MKDLRDGWAALAPQFLSLLRIVSAFILFQAGTSKFFGWPMGMPPGVTLPQWSQTWIGGWMEIVGGALLFVGLGTRFVAFILSGEMAVAYWQFHFGSAVKAGTPGAIWPAVNQGIPAAVLCLVFLYISAAGAGPLSLDALFRKSKGHGDAAEVGS